MKRWFLLGVLIAVLAHFPALMAALVGLLGAVAVWAAAKPPVLAFAAGLYAWPRIARRLPRSTR